MSSNICIAVSPPTLRALLDFHSEQNGEIDPADLADLAICEWLQRQREQTRPPGQRGYFWKALFMPEGTRLRAANHSATRYATIVGDDLVYNAMTMSPNQFVQMTLGSARSAWDVIQVQLPGEREWKPARRLRHALEAQARRSANKVAAPPQEQPAESLLAPQLRQGAEERRKAHRRAEDLLLD